MSFFQISGWLESVEGLRLVERRASQAARIFLKEGLSEKLREELAALLKPGSKDHRFSNSLWPLSAELGVLCLAEKMGLEVSEDVWRVIDRDFIPVVLEIDEINFQGRNNQRKWNSDLATSEIGVNLALALDLDSRGRLDRKELENFLRGKCLEPILADWVNHETRLHSLDTMGHNWWSVLVGGAGVMALIFGDRTLTAEISNHLYSWFHYSGRPLAHKQPNFGARGDFVESFHYADYGLFYPVVFSLMSPSFELVPKALDVQQIRGLAAWLRKSILPEGEGYPQQRFGDIQFYDGFMGTVWQTVAKLAGDREMASMAHRLRPEPKHVLEMLFWEERPEEAGPADDGSSLDVFPHSGMAFLRNDDLRLTVRAGEFWGHNHLDAGSFIFHQSGVTWVDDSGACEYGRSEYPEYYVSAQAHNVAFAPELSPPSRKAHYESLPKRAGYLTQEHQGPLKVLCADTGILSGGALARSYRWFLELDGDGILIWDDLAAYTKQKFTFLLHSGCRMEGESSKELFLMRGDERCSLNFYSSEAVQENSGPAPMGQISDRGEKPSRDLPGHVLSWKTDPVDRVKFGLVMGTGVQKAEWLCSEDNGGECHVTTEKASWKIWFNPRADGRVMHENCVAVWGDFETDAYALIYRKENGREYLSAMEASFVRRNGNLLQGSLERKTLVTLQLPLSAVKGLPKRESILR